MTTPERGRGRKRLQRPRNAHVFKLVGVVCAVLFVTCVFVYRSSSTSPAAGALGGLRGADAAGHQQQQLPRVYRSSPPARLSSPEDGDDDIDAAGAGFDVSAVVEQLRLASANASAMEEDSALGDGAMDGLGAAALRERVRTLEGSVADWGMLLEQAKAALASQNEKQHAELALARAQVQKERLWSRGMGGAAGGAKARSAAAAVAAATELPPLRIYVYDMPEHNVDYVKINPMCRHDYKDSTWQTKYTAEVYFHEALLASPLRTTDPESADLYYVPLYIACFMHGRATNFIKGNELVAEVIGKLRSDYPYWDRSEGRDHVWFFTHDIGGCLAPYLALRHSILLTNTGDLESRPDAFGTYTGMYTPSYGKTRDLSLPCFSPWKDIVVPPFISDRDVLARVHGREDGRQDRPLLASFRGTIMKGGAWNVYSRGIRQKWLSLFQYDDEVRVTHKHPSEEKNGYYKQQYMEEFRTSRYCLCPPGWATWTPRLYESLLLGCIPAVVADNNMLPFQRTLFYPSFSVFIPEKRAGDIKTILKAIPPKRVAAMQAKIDDVAGAFLYHSPPKPGDAFYHIAHELYWRVQTLGLRDAKRRYAIRARGFGKRRSGKRSAGGGGGGGGGG